MLSPSVPLVLGDRPCTMIFIAIMAVIVAVLAWDAVRSAYDRFYSMVTRGHREKEEE